METLKPYSSITFTGINDSSSQPEPKVEVPISQHTPLFAVMTQMGRRGIQIINSNEFPFRYGQQSLEVTSDYYTHQSEAVNTCIEAGNSTIAINRIIPPKAEKASLSLGVDSMLPGEYFIGNVKEAHSSPTYLPIYDIVLDNEGEWGNEYGYSIVKGTDYDRMLLGIDENVQVYRFRLLKLNKFNTTVTVVPNKYGAEETSFVLRPNTTGRGNIAYFFTERLTDCYYVDEGEDFRRMPIIGEIKFHFENFTQLVTESPKYDPETDVWNQDLDTLYGTNLIMFRPWKGEHYFTFTGGNDGLDSDIKSYIMRRLERVRIYDDAVYEFLMGLTEINPETDIAKYPYSNLWDTGFSYNTKLAMRTLVNTRRDCWVAVSVFTVADYFEQPDGSFVWDYVPRQTEEQINALGEKIKAAFKLYPESFHFGTSAVRAIILKNSGVIDNSTYKKRRSVAIHLIKILSGYLGAGNGKWVTGKAIDHEDIKPIRGWSEIDGLPLTGSTRLMNSQNSLLIVDTYDTKSYHFPYYVTIYGDDTSVLNDFLTMLGCCYLEKLGHEAFRIYGSSNLTPKKRMEKIINFIEQNTVDKFDGRFDIEAMVATNEQGTPSTDVKVLIGADKTKVSNLFIIESHRMSDLGTREN